MDSKASTGGPPRCALCRVQVPGAHGLCAFCAPLPSAARQARAWTRIRQRPAHQLVKGALKAFGLSTVRDALAAAAELSPGERGRRILADVQAPHTKWASWRRSDGPSPAGSTLDELAFLLVDPTRSWAEEIARQRAADAPLNAERLADAIREDQHV
jgi:hypothetical protein